MAHSHPLRESLERSARDYSRGRAIQPQRYAPFVAGYGAGVTAFAALFHRSGRHLPRAVSAADLALLGTATFKLSRLISRAKVTSTLRFPFTRFQEEAPGPEVSEEPRGEGLRHEIGELLTCPFCTSQWVGTALFGLYLVDQPVGRTVASLFGLLVVSDALQYAETALHESVDRG